jgi:hypothetical protein
MWNLVKMGGDFVKKRQSFFRFLDIQARDGKSCVHDEKIAERDVSDQRSRDSTDYATDFGLYPLIPQEFYHANRNGEAHASGLERRGEPW